MAFAFDTLGYAKRLRDAGVPAQEAEAHAEAAREFIMTELVTKSDMEVLRRELEASMDNRELRLMAALGDLRHDLTGEIASIDRRLTGVDAKLAGSITSTRQDLDGRIQRVENRFDTLELRLMVRFGGMLAVAVAILAALIKF